MSIQGFRSYLIDNGGWPAIVDVNTAAVLDTDTFFWHDTALPHVAFITLCLSLKYLTHITFDLSNRPTPTTPILSI